MLVLVLSFSFPCVERLRTCDLDSGCLFPGDLFFRSPEMLSTFCALFLSLGFSLLGQPYFAEAGKVNITIDDTDSSIIYEPTTAWVFSGNASGCTVCLSPPVAYNNTWHQGLHIPPTPSVNDTGSASGRKRRDDASADGTSKRRNDLSGERRAAPDPSQDVPVSAQLNFTGSTIYLYCILPLGRPPNADSAPTLMNLTFTLDSEPAGNFLHSGSATNHGFQSTVSVFSRRGLPDSTHSLLVNLGPNSVFLFDYYVVSRTDCSDSNPCPTQGQASSTTDSHKHNIRTIAGAVGGCVVVLVMFAACLEFSIYRRRRGVARRQMRDRDRQVETQSFHSDVSGNPSLLPRYFPSTLSSAPPPYFGPAESSVATQSDLSSVEMYHQTPPLFHCTPSHPPTGAIPPLVTHDRGPLDLPPPFSAVSSPSPPVHTGGMPRTAQPNSPRGHTEDTAPASPEVAPILLTVAVVTPSRPTRILRRSRSSSLPDIDSATTSSFPSAKETRPLSAEY